MPALRLKQKNITMTATLVLMLAGTGCTSAPTNESATAFSPIPIHHPFPIPIYLGPTATPSALSFRSVTPSVHYEQTVWFAIDQADNFSARIANSYGGAVHITNMQAWWNAWGCSVNSSNPNCFDESIGGAGSLSVDAAEMVGVTVSIDPSFASPGAINTDLVVSGTNNDWTENIPITANSVSCQEVVHGFDVINSPRYNGLLFTVTSQVAIDWHWKVTSGNLNAQDTIAPGTAGTYVDVSSHFAGPPYTVYPNTHYMVAFTAAGAGPSCTVHIQFLTPPDPTPSCVVDHACPGDPANGDNGGGDEGGGFVSCQDGDDCCPGGDCQPD
jgi:hypothetical protein